MELFYFDIMNFFARKHNSSSVVGDVFLVSQFPVISSYRCSHLGSTKFAERTAVSGAAATAQNEKRQT
jgi:hypothetical protein